MSWDVVRWWACVAVIASFGGMVAITRIYRPVVERTPWWRKLLPLHVVYVALGTALVFAGLFGFIFDRVGMKPVWQGVPLLLTAVGATVFFVGTVYMVRFLALKAREGVRSDDVARRQR